MRLGLLSAACAAGIGVASPSAHAASLIIDDTIADPNIRFSEDNFADGFFLNGFRVQIGLDDPQSQTVSENGPVVDGAAQNFFGGFFGPSAGQTPENQTIFFTEPGSASISDVLHFTYATDGILDGYVISDNDSAPPLTVAALNAAGIFATATVTETNAPFTFNNFGITASFQSDVPELPTWAMMLGGFGLLGLAAMHKGMREARLAV